MSEPVYLCRLDDLADPGSMGFQDIDGQKPFFVVRRAQEVFGYRNLCPHYGAPLDWKPDAFLTYEKDYILCSMHSALFNIGDGICVDGPCPGQGLEPVLLVLQDGGVFIAV